MRSWIHISAVVVLAFAYPTWSQDDVGTELDKLLGLPAATDNFIRREALERVGGEDGNPLTNRKQLSVDNIMDLLEPEEASSQNEQQFMEVVADMRLAADHLKQDQATVAATRVQKRVIERLDALIAEVKRNNQNQNQSGSSSSSGSQQDVKKPQSQQSQQAQSQQEGSQDAAQDASAGTAAKPQEGGALTEHLNEWGSLPVRLRKQLMQGMEDRFSSLYRNLTEQYYRRLAEESQE